MNNYSSNNYSEQLENDLWVAVGNDYDKDYEFGELIDKIKSKDFFRPFPERLLAFYNDILQKDFSADEACTDLLHRKVALSRNTVKNWFAGKSEPKYGDNDRRNMFAVAFALELDVNQTERLFHKVFLDKAFNKRNAEEFIYLYCIYNKKPLPLAEELIEKLSEIDNNITPEDCTERTQFLADAAKQDVSTKDILQFIVEHQHNFSLNNNAAKKYRNGFIEKLTVGRLAQQEYNKCRAELADEKDASGFEGRAPTSVDFLIYMLMGVDFAQKDNKEIRSIRDKFPREISNQFPDKQSLSQKNPSSYVLRKDIILLYFYSYWVTDFLNRQNLGNYDGFVDELNDILFDCGYSPLYIGNPYDWLFLYCSACPSNPLDVFRGILAPSD